MLDIVSCLALRAGIRTRLLVAVSAACLAALLLMPERLVAEANRPDASTAETVAVGAELEKLLLEAEKALQRGWLLAPRGRSAVDFYARALELDPANETAKAGLSGVQRRLVDEAIALAQVQDHEAAARVLNQAAALNEDPLLVAWGRARLTHIRQQQLADAEADIEMKIERGRFDQAEERVTDLIAMGMERSRINLLRSRLSYARRYGALRPGQIFYDPFVDGEHAGPLMVVIPSGSFMKGSPDNEAGRQRHEGPRYRVTFERGFALARTETTVGEFGLFVEQTEYQTDAERIGWSRVYEPRSGRMTRRNRVNWRHDYLGREAAADLPVIHVSWRDAAAYADWLAEQTQQPYRLPSEAEFEYALRAGTQTRYWWGEGSPTEPVENLTGDGDLSPTNSRWNVAFPRYTDGFWGPAPVASLAPNPFGLYDMGGNVMQWTLDCWHDSFVRAPVDGSAWINPGCTHRVIRGGSWSSTPDMSRSAFRVSGAEDSRDMRLGFRVARDI